MKDFLEIENQGHPTPKSIQIETWTCQKNKVVWMKAMSQDQPNFLVNKQKLSQWWKKKIRKKQNVDLGITLILIDWIDGFGPLKNEKDPANLGKKIYQNYHQL